MSRSLYTESNANLYMVWKWFSFLWPSGITYPNHVVYTGNPLGRFKASEFLRGSKETKRLVACWRKCKLGLDKAELVLASQDAHNCSNPLAKLEPNSCRIIHMKA